ncbi:hypothetical protein GIB67_026239 [Kingdonia uniflora]|uniref:ABC-2 type transporter transmembrane domain-containing protein n=1 Tax=Kingdonia uniflora TaxID=39325 RepID=A0A7J7L9S2_9MAGN|nr:hypothetical protein GIB67_026239 [Kingdonia uniflora]
MALSLFRFIAAAGRTTVVANTLGTFTLLLVFILGGYIVAKDDIEPFIIWGYYVSPMSYGQNAIAMNEFLDDRWSTIRSSDFPSGKLTVGKALLRARGLYTDEYWVDSRQRRDEYTKERLDAILNCAHACPNGLNPGNR